jgi:ribosomal protein L11 methyltransferase
VSEDHSSGSLTYQAITDLPEGMTEHQVQHLCERWQSQSENMIGPEGFLSLSARENNPLDWTLTLFFNISPDPHILSSHLGSLLNEYNLAPSRERNTWDISPISPRDWLAESYRSFPPFALGPFFIYGSHYTGNTPDELIGLQIDAATAFGSGEHPTTAGCLKAMAELKDSGVCPWNILDMGTGSGILAIAAWKLWRTPVLAIDNDPAAIELTELHRAINAIPLTEFRCEEGDGFDAASVREQQPYELIIANILAAPLIHMAPAMAATCDENGYVILSGLLETQAPDVIHHYEKSGFKMTSTHPIKEWTTLVFHNTNILSQNI